MVPRAVWKGTLKFGMVSCSVKLTGAVSESDSIKFRTLSRSTGSAVRAQYQDDVTGEAVEAADQIKGYELSKHDFLKIEPDEVKALKIASSHTLDIDSFVDIDRVDRIYLDKPYYLAPADRLSAEPFATIREAMARKHAAALAPIVLYQRERPVVIEPHGRGMRLTTLRYKRAIVPAAAAFSDLGETAVDPEMAEIAELIIAKKRGRFDPKAFEDRYENALIALIEAKRSGSVAPKFSAAPRKGVVNLIDALKKSLRAERAAPAKPAKARISATNNESSEEKRLSA